MIVSYNMGEWREIPDILKLGRADTSVWLITFALTVFADLTVAVEAGMILAALLYIQKVTATTTVTKVSKEYVDEGFAHSLQTNPLPDGLALYRIHGPFLFGSTDKLSAIYEDFDSLPSIVLLRLRNMTAIDATGLHALEDLADRLHGAHRHLLLCAPRHQPAKLMEQAEFHLHIGDANIQPSLETAIRRAQELLASTGTGVGS
jgi:SulP family sulfate permease